MRIVHFSDTHLGHQQFSRTAPNGLNQREQDHYDAFGHIIDHCIDVRPDLVIHSGDLFDGVRPSNRALAVALGGFVRLSQAGIPTIIIAGNHEHPKMLETGSPMRLFEHLEHVHPVFKGRRETLELGGRRIHAVPQCPDNAALRDAVESIDADGSDVLILHGGVQGIEAFHHAEFNELSIDPAWFTGSNAERFAYVALGHYHGATEIAPHAWYAGAPDRVSIREAGEAKGFLDVDLADPPRVTFHPLPSRAYVDVPRIRATGVAADALEAIVRERLDGIEQGAVARMRIDDVPASLRGALDVKGLHQAARHLLDLDLRITFADDAHHTVTADVGDLAQEFESFAATYPIDGVDRDALLAAARSVLGAP